MTNRLRTATVAISLGIAAICGTAQATTTPAKKANVVTSAGWTRASLPILPAPYEETYLLYGTCRRPEVLPEADL
jgi:hypothetical protein